TGGYRDGSRAAVVGGAVEALERAAQGPGPVTLELAERETAGLVSPRSGESSDQRLTRLLLRGPEGPIAQLVVFSAHPTLVARRTQALSPDFVGPFLAELEKEGGVALFLQGAAGNATVSDASGGPEGFAGRLAATCRETGLSPLGEEVRLGYARVSVSLPRPDSSRAVPGLFRAVGDNFLCGSASHRAELSALQLGPVKLISVPGEVTRAAASPLEERGRASRAVSLVNGYLGYVEAPGLVTSGAGESRRQYFGSGLLESFARGAELAGAHLE
ncbi:MAG: hypothetical protein HYZ28_25485, partial [Myxococcales bacterium]|nr:hypothetical protein [Myxococcales bacterium]